MDGSIANSDKEPVGAMGADHATGTTMMANANPNECELTTIATRIGRSRGEGSEGNKTLHLPSMYTRINKVLECLRQLAIAQRQITTTIAHVTTCPDTNRLGTMVVTNTNPTT